MIHNDKKCHLTKFSDVVAYVRTIGAHRPSPAVAGKNSRSQFGGRGPFRFLLGVGPKFSALEAGFVDTARAGATGAEVFHFILLKI